MYSKCGSLSDARWMFERMLERNVFSWSTMISSYAQNEHGKKALQLFKQMESQSIIADKITFVGILDECTSLGNLREGKRIHSCILCSGFESNIVVRTALINMYGKSGSLEVAKMLFNRMSERDIVSWNAIITAYSHNGNGRSALELFRHLLNQSQEPDRITYVTILKACSDLTSLAEGKHIHAYIMDSQFCTDAIVGTAVVNMYGKCKRLDDAQRSFDKLTNPDLQSWNSLIAAYSQNEPGPKALQLFQQMQLEGLEPNSNTFISVLDACASLSALDQGKTVHAQIVESGLDNDVLIGTALINRYNKCGRLDDAHAVLQNASVRNFISCNAMVAAYGHNGHGKEALVAFPENAA